MTKKEDLLRSVKEIEKEYTGLAYLPLIRRFKTIIRKYLKHGKTNS